MTNSSVDRRWDFYQIPPSFVLGFHGCKSSVGEAVLGGHITHLLPSAERYDWLGKGIYFWEGSPRRAWEWAVEKKKRDKHWPEDEPPFVLGAVINLGQCLDFRDSSSLLEVKDAYEVFRSLTADEEMPENEGNNDDNVFRHLDCAVINSLHSRREDKNLSPYNSVRADFWEGGPLYPGAGFRQKDHIQICVCDTDSIIGYFRPIEQS